MDFLKKKQKEQINENFNNWFKQSKVHSKSKDPLIVYHATTHTFSKFERSNEHNFLGSAYYFSDSFHDANTNYTADGSDLKHNISNEKEIAQDLYDNDYDDFLLKYESYLNDIDEEVLENLHLYEDVFQYPFENRDEFIDSLNVHKVEFDISQVDSIIKCQNLFEKVAISIVKGEHEGCVMPCFLSFQNPFYYSKDDREGTNFNLDVVLEGEILDFKELMKDFIHIEFNDSEFSVEDFFEENQSMIESLIQDNNCINQSEIIELIENSNEIEFLSEEQGEQLLEWAKSELKSYYEGDLTIEGTYQKFKESADNISYQYGVSQEIESFFHEFEEQYHTHNFNPHFLIDTLKAADFWCSAYNENKSTQGHHLSGEFIKDTLEDAGYDSIIMDVDSANFNFDEMEPGTKHYLAFSSNQVKSAIGNCGDYSLDNLDIAAKMNTKGSIFEENLSHEEIKKEVIKISKCWKNKPKIMFFNSPSDIPILHKKMQPLLHDIDEQTKSLISMDTNKQDNDILYVFTNNFKNRLEAEEVMAHEIIGHYGLRKREGKEYKKTLKKIYSKYKSSPVMDLLAIDYAQKIKSVSKYDRQLILADEFLALKAESFKEPGIKIKLKILASDMLNKIGCGNVIVSSKNVDDIIFKNKLFIEDKSILKSILDDIKIDEIIKNNTTSKNRRKNKPC